MARPTATAAGMPGFARQVPAGMVARAPMTPITRPRPARGSHRRSAALPATTPRPRPAARRSGPHAGPDGAVGGVPCSSGGRRAISGTSSTAHTATTGMIPPKIHLHPMDSATAAEMLGPTSPGTMNTVEMAPSMSGRSRSGT